MNIYSLKEPAALAIACEILDCGGIIAFPSDTLYGFCADFTASSVNRLHQVRKRSLYKPFLLVLPENYALKKCVESISIDQKKFIQKCWPGRVTVILPKKKKLFYPLGNSIGLRKPNKEDCIYFYKLLNLLSRPLLSTSLNLPGGNTINDPIEAKNKFSDEIDAYFTLPNYIQKKQSEIWDLTINPPRQIR